MNFIEDFWARVNLLGECWEWGGLRTYQNYGYMSFGSRKMLAHRLAYEQTYGRIPAGLYICHRCDNPPCVRPDHLFVGTQADNMRDCLVKGRHRHGPGLKPGQNPNPLRGEAHGQTKLTDQQIAEIRERYSSSDIPRKKGVQAALAREYGISKSHMCRIISGKNRVPA